MSDSTPGDHDDSDQDERPQVACGRRGPAVTGHPPAVRVFCILSVLFATTAQADGDAGDAPAPPWNLHGQFTNVLQYHPAFRSPYQGTNSLDPGNNGRETSDLTLFAGVPLWPAAALYVNPEIDQGYGLSGTLGMAGFPSGE